MPGARAEPRAPTPAPKPEPVLPERREPAVAEVATPDDDKPSPAPPDDDQDEIGPIEPTILLSKGD